MRVEILCRFVLAVASLSVFPLASHAADEPPASATPAARPPLRIAPIVITPTRDEQSSFDVPASIDVLDREQIQTAQPQVNLSETLVRIPGIVAQNRQNYAQDLQISSRGFGARSTFGVRGIRLLADEIPLTSPDGQGQAATVDLGTAKRIEVLRGPFSALYGNSSGGVIAVFTEDPPDVPTLSADAGGGSYDTSKFGVKFGDQLGQFGYLAHASRFATDGYRDHSAARRDQVSGKFNYAVNDDVSLTFVATGLHQPDTLDPLGLTRAEAEADPTAAAPTATQFDTRKSIRHYQEGLVYENRFSDANAVRLLGYVGTRDVRQYLAIPLAVQQGDLHSGGVIDLDRRFGGVDGRFIHRTRLRDQPLTLTAGIAYDNQEERRTGFINNFGIAEVLKRDEDNRVYNFDQYAQAQWQFAPQWTTTIGMRHSEVKFQSTDSFINANNPDDSGSVRFSETTPVAGILFKLTPDLNLYANAGRGFETPTFVEIAYKPDGTSGLNLALQPSTSNNFEVGLKSLVGEDRRLNLALFRIDTKNEIVVASNQGGRTTFQNAGRTERRGAELALETGLGRGFSGYVALAYIDAKYAEPFSACISAPPCTVPTLIPGGNKVPGVPRATMYGELAWRHEPLGFHTAIEARWTDRIFVDDINSASADNYTVVNWRAGFEHRIGRLAIAEFARIDNLFDRQYIGSVIVNAGGGRFYEPAPNRNYFAGVQASYRF